MDYLNSPTNDIFKKTIEKQTQYIDDKIDNSKIRFLTRNIKLLGTKNEICEFLNLGIAQNLIQTFFKFDIVDQFCVHCKKNKTEVKQLERAHCNHNNYDRGYLLLKAIDKIYVDEDTPINSIDILKEFIINHKTVPIYLLCKKCHIEYDKC